MLLTPSHNCPWPAKILLTPHLFAHSLPRCCAPLACLPIACQDAAPPIACLAIACQDAARLSPVCPCLPRCCSLRACLPIASQDAAQPSPVCPQPAKMLRTPHLFAHTFKLTCFRGVINLFTGKLPFFFFVPPSTTISSHFKKKGCSL